MKSLIYLSLILSCFVISTETRATEPTMTDEVAALRAAARFINSTPQCNGRTSIASNTFQEDAVEGSLYVYTLIQVSCETPRGLISAFYVHSSNTNFLDTARFRTSTGALRIHLTNATVIPSIRGIRSAQGDFQLVEGLPVRR